jgi:hypothetical protein
VFLAGREREETGQLFDCGTAHSEKGQSRTGAGGDEVWLHGGGPYVLTCFYVCFDTRFFLNAPFGLGVFFLLSNRNYGLIFIFGKCDSHKMGAV